MKARFFLSYARADGTEACEFFEAALKNLEHDVYRDLTGNHGGDLWQEKIRDQIRRADAFLLFLTPGALKSPNVEKEWREALALRKRIVPLKVGTSDVPPELLGYHVRDVQAEEKLHLEVSEVVRTVAEVRKEIARDIADLRQRADEEIPDSVKRRHLAQLWSEMDLLFRKAEPAALPEEGFRVFKHLADKLIDELARDGDIGPDLDAMISGAFPAAGWDRHPVYIVWLESVARALKKVRAAMPRIAVPVVVVAMTRQEADDLEAGTAFGPWPSQLKAEFDSLVPNLPATWTDRYGAAPEDWKPFGAETVNELIRKAFKFVEQDGKCQLPLEPSFVDIRKLRQNRKQLRDLRSGHCLVIVDCVSTRHPLLHSAFRGSHLDVSPNTIVVRTLAGAAFAPLTASVEVLVREWLDCEFYYRTHEDDDPACADVTQWDDFRKVIRNQIPRCIPDCAPRQNNAAERWAPLNNVGRPGQ